MHADAAQNTKRCSAVCKADCRAAYAGCQTILFRLAGGAHTQMLENTRSDCPQKIMCQHLYAESCLMLNPGWSQPACIQAPAQDRAAAAEHARGLYRRKYGNCVQTFTARPAGCARRLSNQPSCSKRPRQTVQRRASPENIPRPRSPALLPRQ
jgi:hypothetical protein